MRIGTTSTSSTLLVSGAVVAFAANSLLCRLALRPPARVDAVTFTTVRLLSGAVVLSLLAAWPDRRLQWRHGTWPSATALFAYAIAFSVAYVRMTAATGALILFAAVQLTMIAVAIARGERPTPLQWFGLALALSGLVILSRRGVAAPDPLAASLMTMAGIAWGIYSLRGRASTRPLADTAGNFVCAAPLALIVTLFALRGAHVSVAGLLLATASGAIASGLGYTIWYAALPRLTATRASIVQLAVPVVAAAGGIALLGERPTLRLGVATVTILSGVGMAVLSRRRR